MDANRAGDRARSRAVSKTQTDGRAVVRQHQTQQRLLPLPPARQDQGTTRVATTDDDPQPHQGSPPPNRRREGLTAPKASQSPFTAGATPTTRPAVNRPSDHPPPLRDSVPGGPPPPLKNGNRRGYLQVSLRPKQPSRCRRARCLLANERRSAGCALGARPPSFSPGGSTGRQPSMPGRRGVSSGVVAR